MPVISEQFFSKFITYNFKIFTENFRIEIKFILRTSFIKGFSTALSVFTERFILYAAVVTFVVTGGEISSDITFSLVQYYNLMQLACNILFPMALAFLAESRVSIRRLEVVTIFFLSHERDISDNKATLLLGISST